jgi:hypothetical protein
MDPDLPKFEKYAEKFGHRWTPAFTELRLGKQIDTDLPNPESLKPEPFCAYVSSVPAAYYAVNLWLRNIGLKLGE